MMVIWYNMPQNLIVIIKAPILVVPCGDDSSPATPDEGERCEAFTIKIPMLRLLQFGAWPGAQYCPNSPRL